MKIASLVLTGLIAVQHLWFLVLEMFLFTKPIGLATFKISQEVANQSAVLAMNQALYNGFLSAGLIWSLLTRDQKLGTQVRLFFLGCVAVAGTFGAVTVGPPLFFLQALPALITFAL